MSKYRTHPRSGNPASPRKHAAAGSESDFLTWVRSRQQQYVVESQSRTVLVGAGDDLAVLDWTGGLLLVGMDPVLDGVHVELSRHGPAAAGRKAMNRNLSDVAAMGAEAVAAIVSLVVPKSMSLEDVKRVYVGAEEAGSAANCPIVGGDFASWDGRLVVTIGILARTDAPLLRGDSAAALAKRSDGWSRPHRVQAGHTIFVTGALGGSGLGRHLTFTPRLGLGRLIAREFGATAMLDVSDGLSRDLPRLLGASLGATIDAARIPVHEDAARLSQQTGRDPLWHALNDGEDYELLFTAAAKSIPNSIAIGQVQSQPGVRLVRDGRVEPLEPEGWEHRLARRPT